MGSVTGLGTFLAVSGSQLYKGWRAWLWVSVFLGMGELVTLGRFYFGSAILGSLVAAIIAASGANWVVQVIAFVVGATAAVLFVRPWIAHHIHLDRMSRAQREEDERARRERR